MTSLTDLGLAPLGNNGGPTQTMALLPGSAAIGAGVIADYPGTTTPITTDQRGDPLDSPEPDIGAFQTQGRPALIGPTFSGISDAEYHLRHLQRDLFRYAHERFAGAGGRDRGGDLERR